LLITFKKSTRNQRWPRKIEAMKPPNINANPVKARAHICLRLGLSGYISECSLRTLCIFQRLTNSTLASLGNFRLTSSRIELSHTLDAITRVIATKKLNTKVHPDAEISLPSGWVNLITLSILGVKPAMRELHHYLLVGAAAVCRFSSSSNACWRSAM